MKNKYLLSVLAAVSAAVVLAACGSKGPESGSSAQPGAAIADQAGGETENLARGKPGAGKVEYDSRTLTGEGPTFQAAVKNALLPYVMETNGVSVSAATAELDSSLNASLNGKNYSASASGFMDLSGSHTEGHVSGFRIVSNTEDKKSGVHSVTLEIRTPKFTRPESANRLSVAIADFRTNAGSFTIDKTNVASDEVVKEIRQHLVNALTKSGRVSVLDREFESETASELQRLSSGKVPADDLARLGQQIATDYVLVGSIDRFSYDRHERALRTSDRTIISHSGGAALSFRLINVATGSIEQSETIAIDLPETEPTTLGTSVDVEGAVAKLTNGLSEQASTRVITQLFPVTVLSVDGDDVVLSQGGDTLTEGKAYEIVARGKELKDPQTGQSLGRVEKPCCIVLVTKVTPQMAYGTLVSKSIDVASAFAPGALELRGHVSVPTASVATATVAADVAKVAASAPAAVEGLKPADARKKAATGSDKDW